MCNQQQNVADECTSGRNTRTTAIHYELYSHYALKDYIFLFRSPTKIQLVLFRCSNKKKHETKLRMKQSTYNASKKHTFLIMC